MFSKKCKQHLRDQDETGLEHMFHAIKTAVRLQLLIPVLLIHAVAPRFFTDRGTTVIQDILKDRKIQ
mgnify:CR=1 FL=1|jgi:hypothetical protein